MTSEQGGAVSPSPAQRTTPARFTFRTLSRERPGDAARLELRVVNGPDEASPSTVLTVSVAEVEDLIAQLQAFVTRASTPVTDQLTRRIDAAGTRQLRANTALTLNTTE